MSVSYIKTIDLKAAIAPYVLTDHVSLEWTAKGVRNSFNQKALVKIFKNTEYR